MNTTQFRRRLLAWFDRHQRDLPWRRNRDPYRIWVSEVMLQQTTVAAVIPYFERFMAAFPTVQALAAADEQQVLHIWQGLGYYRRARNLHAAARRIVAECYGQLSNDPDVWTELPGVGRYILGAVLSQAFDRRLPIVEANSLRVFCRLFGQQGDPNSNQVKKWLWQTAEEMLPRKRVGDLNQAIMELGALVCTPADPKCDRCPVQRECSAHRDGIQHRIPFIVKKVKSTDIREVAVVIRRGNKVLIAQRSPDSKRWANMWEFPQTELRDAETHDQAARRWLRKSMGLTVKLKTELTTVRYAVTRYRMTLVALQAIANGKLPVPLSRLCGRGVWGEGSSRRAAYPPSPPAPLPQSRERGGRKKEFVAEYVDARWIAVTEVKNYPMSTAQRRLVNAVIATSRQRRLF